VSKFNGDWLSRSAVAVAFLLTVGMFVSATRAQVGRSPSPQARKRMVRAVDKTLQEGLHAKLPPHLSTLLGLSKEEECPVMQGMVRTGKVVQGFDVSTANKNDAVLFVVNETTNDQTLYLTSKEGVLRKSSEGRGGGGPGSKDHRRRSESVRERKAVLVGSVSPGRCAIGSMDVLQVPVSRPLGKWPPAKIEHE
jgi:hypothetical protein